MKLLIKKHPKYYLVQIKNEYVADFLEILEIRMPKEPGLTYELVSFCPDNYSNKYFEEFDYESKTPEQLVIFPLDLSDEQFEIVGKMQYA